VLFRSYNEAADKGPPVVKKVSPHIVSAVMQATASMTIVSSKVEDSSWLPTRERKSYLSLKNGILDIDKLIGGQSDYMIEHSPDWFSKITIPYEFDKTATCPRFEAFLEHNQEMDPERIKILQEWAGYLLLPNTDEAKFMILEGEGSNGKSVFTAALTAMLGEDNVSSVSLEVFGDRFSRTDTLGKLLNAAGDCAELDKVAEGYIKSFSSGDRMFFDRKGISGINCVPTARLMVSCNNRPRFRDQSRGIWRRMLLIPWRVEIDTGMKIKGMDKVKWWQQSGELPGILRWAIVGLARLRAQNGFTESEVMNQALVDYQEDMNPAKAFLIENLEVSSSGEISTALLYKVYKSWIEQNGHGTPKSDRAFGREVKRMFRLSEKRLKNSGGDRYYAYSGIRFSRDEVAGQVVNELF
jgi:P4 family phage/plasmid primase-like protien